MTADKPGAGKVFAPGGRGKAGAKDAPSKAAMQAPKIGAAVVPSAGDAQEDARLETWAEQFDAKLNQLTARQDAFLKYLELQAHQA